MPNNQRPGVYLQEVLTPSYALTSPNSAVAVFIGPHFQGPTAQPKLISSWSQFLLLFGGFPDTASGQPFSFLPHAVFQFFNNGGRFCYVLRTTHTDGVAATRTGHDRAATPANTWRVDATSVGAWGNALNYDIIDRDATNGRFDLILKLGGTSNSNIVERWIDISLDPNSDRYAPGLINSPVSPSNYIHVTDLNSPTAFPNNTPAVGTDRTFTGGADGAAVTTSDLNNSLDLFDTIPGPFILNYPGEYRTAVVDYAVTKAETRGDMFVVIDTNDGLGTAANIIAFVETVDPSSSFGAVYAPWLWVPDPSSASPGATKLLPPGAFVIGKMAETDSRRGVFKAPAGLETRLLNVIDTEMRFTNTDLDSLNGSNVNIIRMPAPNAGFCIMGTRTLAVSGVQQYVPARRTLIYLEKALIDGTQWAVFEPNDAVLWSALTMSISQFLRDFWKIGGLRGASVNQAFYVKCDADINTQQVIDSGSVYVEVGVAIQRPTEFVVITLGQWDGGNSVTEQANQ